MRGGSVELFTLGYEGLTPGRYFEIIQAAGCETLVDVRRLPASRKPGFSKKRLTEAAAAHGLAYVHMVALGTPQEILYAYRESHDHAIFERDFNAYLATQQATVSELAERTKSEVCCLMCVEADIRHCHRRIVADAVVEALGGSERCEIVHLTMDGR